VQATANFFTGKPFPVPHLCVILVAAGQSQRFKASTKKPFVPLAGQPVWLHSATTFHDHQSVSQLILVVGAEDHDRFLNENRKLAEELDLHLVAGGPERVDSVQNALHHVNARCDYLVIHDAARPCFDAELLERVLNAAIKTGAAIPAIAVDSTIKRSTNGQTIDMTVDRSQLFLAQTPQVFRKDLIVQAYQQRRGAKVTDDAQLLENMGVPVSIVEGSKYNLKLTTAQDLEVAEAIMKIRQQAGR
jgi:2-C-methyl-D-erythritol 4-phosphate cytidylyltransferase